MANAPSSSVSNGGGPSALADAEIPPRPRPRVGGPWQDFLSMTKESITKLLRQSVPKTRSARLSWLAGHHEVDSEQRVDQLQVVDGFALAVAALLSPLAAAAYPVLVVLALPGSAALRMYLACLQRPSNDLHQDSVGFHALAALLWLLALPFFAVVAAYGLVVFPTILAASALYAAAAFKLGNLNENMALLRNCNHWPKCVWSDCVRSIAGTMDRQGFWKLVLKLPSAFVLVPVLKYLFGANPLLYKLSIRYRNMWTSPLDVQDDKAVAAVVQAVSWPLIATNLMEPDVEQMPQVLGGCSHQPVLKADRIVSGHIPFPAEDRGARSVVAVLTSNGVVTFASAEHNVNGSIFHSMTAKRSIYNLLLYTWNPCHYLTGYVEVNLQHDGGIEQPMWCVVGDNYVGNWLFEHADALLWHFDPNARSRVSLASTLSFDGDVGHATSITDINDAVETASQSIAVLESASELGTGRSTAFMMRDTITSTESFVV